MTMNSSGPDPRLDTGSDPRLDTGPGSGLNAGLNTGPDPRPDNESAAHPDRRRPIRRAAVTVPAGLTAAGLLASGCGAATAATHQDTSARAAAAGSAQSATPSCTANALRLSAGPGTGAAGSTYYALDFTNVGRSTCTLDGYPAVSFVTSGPHRNEVGRPAFRNPAFASHVVTLSPGSTAHADLQVQLAQNYPAAICKPVTAHGLRVLPPGSTDARYLKFSAVTCTGRVPSGATIGISAIRPGALSP
jgi:Protein of unknown function (DUF4232)